MHVHVYVFLVSVCTASALCVYACIKFWWYVLHHACAVYACVWMYYDTVVDLNIFVWAVVDGIFFLYHACIVYVCVFRYVYACTET
jgi:hypothetical protein